MSIQSDGYMGQMDPLVPTHIVNALKFLINQVVSGNWTLTLGLVESVSGGGIAAPAVVSVQPMVNEVDGYGNPTPHGIINNVPVFRLQGGASAFVVDPVAGEIGILACASRDISAVKSNRAPSNPGSFRTFDPSDAMYLGSILGNTPTQYVQVTPSGINIVFPGGISIKITSSGITLAVGTMSIVISSSGITIAGIDFASHVHTGVTAGAANSGPPLP